MAIYNGTIQKYEKKSKQALIHSQESTSGRTGQSQHLLVR
uniref:Uncharacterized protein n=1 Tax=Strigamia maritima TaxID=126957 RepID=T1IZV9_STRMM